MPTVHEVAAHKDAAAAAGRHEAATACMSPVFQALFRVHTLSACDALMAHLLSLHHGAHAFFTHQAQLALKRAAVGAAAAGADAPRQSRVGGATQPDPISTAPRPDGNRPRVPG